MTNIESILIGINVCQEFHVVSPAEQGPPCPLYLPADLYYDRWEVVDGMLVGEYRDNRTGALVTDLPTHRFCVETSPAVRSLTQLQTSQQCFAKSSYRNCDLLLPPDGCAGRGGAGVRPRDGLRKEGEPRHSDI